VTEESRTFAVNAAVSYPSICSTESMHALPDPADPAQAVIQNVPFFVDGLNFGDVVLLGPPDALGIRPIEEIVTPSGHVRFLAVTGPLSADELFEHLYDTFPEYALHIEGHGDGLLAISVHPDLDPDDVAFEVILWFEEHGVLTDDDIAGITELITSEVGPITPPA
jgi:hypothetical protein